MSKVFISYSGDTRQEAEELWEKLRQRGFNAWVDSRNLAAGEPVSDAIRSAVRDAQHYLVLVGPNAYLPNAPMEWGLALEQVWSNSEKRFVPVMVRTDDVPPFLRGWPAVRLDKNSSESFERLIQLLVSPETEIDEQALAQEEERRQKRFEELEAAAKALR